MNHSSLRHFIKGGVYCLPIPNFAKFLCIKGSFSSAFLIYGPFIPFIQPIELLDSKDLELVCVLQ